MKIETKRPIIKKKKVSGESIVKMKTEITELLGIEYPIIQGGMAWVAEYHLAAAVSEAGGLGIIGAASVKVVTTGAGSPEKYMQMWKEADVKVIPVVASVALAERMERCHADAVVAEGTEAGGHIGEASTMTLVPQVVDAVKIPVIAAGGIADGRGIAAAFMLGAKGVQMGTAFIVTEECQVHENYKNEIIRARDIDSKVTGRSCGHPVRTLRNQMTKLTLGGLKKAVVEGDVKNGSLMAGQSAGLVTEKMTCEMLIRKLVKGTEKQIRGSVFYE